MRIGRCLLAVLLLGFGLALSVVPVSLAQAGEEAETAPLLWSARINGEPVRQADSNNPLMLEPRDSVAVTLSARARDEGVTVQSVRLDGHVLGLTFFTYTTRVDLRLAPDARNDSRRRFTVDMRDLEGQAIGLIPASLTLLDEDRGEIARQEFVSDVQGSVRSVYGVFGLAVAAITLLLLVVLLIQLAGQRLPSNRWTRAVRFAIPGVGIGLTATFTLSAVGLLAPNPVTWLSFVMACGVVAFALGYLSPTPDTSAPEAWAPEEGPSQEAPPAVGRQPQPPAVEAIDPVAPQSGPSGPPDDQGSKTTVRRAWSQFPPNRP